MRKKTLRVHFHTQQANSFYCRPDLESNSGINFYPHYGNMSMQCTTIFHSSKNETFYVKKNDNFLIFAHNVDCGYTLKPP